jgi:biotin operon repressor
MDNPSSTTPTPTPPLPPRTKLISAIGCEKRWTILAALCDGEPLPASDIAKLIGCTVSGASKHMWALCNAGVVVQGKGRLYRLAPGVQPQPGQRVVDFGHCVLRLDVQAGN